MGFELSTKAIQSGKAAILFDAKALPGVRKIASKVAADLAAVFGAAPLVAEVGKLTKKDAEKIEYPILVGTLGSCNILTKLEKSGFLKLSDIAGKREVYQHKVIENLPAGVLLPKESTALVIAGSDKRGTVYGLFALSEKLGVSPFIDWLDVQPEKKKSFAFPKNFKYTSKEPSVRFRGFFINDEWPAFGNWCNKRFGGFNAKCYEHVFELLLRLKGNYMWPAMWSAIFPNDRPGLRSAELAD